MAYFSAAANTAVTFSTAFANLAVLTNPLTAYGQQSVNGFSAYLNNQIAVAVTGVGFTFNGVTPTDGVITTLLLKQGGATIGTLTGLALDFSDFVANIAANGVGAAVEQLLSNSDTIVGSSLNDTFYGKGGNDVISGLGGNDHLYGDAGEDTLYGGADIDELFGGAGNDHLFGEAGDDIIYGGAGTNEIDGGSGIDSVSFTDSTASVRVTLNGSAESSVKVGIFQRGTVKNVENVVGGNGNDTITGDGLVNVLDGFNGNDTIHGGGNADKLRGGFGDDLLFGDDGSDELRAGGGDDLLDGGLGADVMEGGSGDDTYVVDYIGDSVEELPGQGVDSVLSSATFALAGEVENLTLTGSAAIDATGNGKANSLVGNAAANRLDGKGGADAMKGGASDDTYVVDNAGDAITEKAGEGVDSVQASVSIKLGAEVENLMLTGAANLSGAGNGLANAISGNAGDNLLSGGLAKDFLTGGDGADSFVFDVKAGKANADTILDFSVGDVIVLDSDVFKKVNDDGVLKSKFFSLGKADDGNDYVTYREGSGKLFYDKDGDGGKHGKLIAKLDGGPDLEAGDFLII